MSDISLLPFSSLSVSSSLMIEMFLESTSRWRYGLEDWVRVTSPGPPFRGNTAMTEPTSKGIIYRNPRRWYVESTPKKTIFFKTELLFKKIACYPLRRILMTTNVFCVLYRNNSKLYQQTGFLVSRLWRGRTGTRQKMRKDLESKAHEAEYVITILAHSTGLFLTMVTRKSIQCSSKWCIM